MQHCCSSKLCMKAIQSDWYPGESKRIHHWALRLYVLPVFICIDPSFLVTLQCAGMTSTSFSNMYIDNYIRSLVSTVSIISLTSFTVHLEAPKSTSKWIAHPLLVSLTSQRKGTFHIKTWWGMAFWSLQVRLNFCCSTGATMSEKG